MVMQYKITDITNNVVTVEFADGSWAQVVTTDGMSEEDFDALVNQFAPKIGVELSFLSVGQSRTAREKAVEESVQMPEWLQSRIDAYGRVQSQLEFITENGLEAWQAEVASIKAQFPKPTDD